MEVDLGEVRRCWPQVSGLKVDGEILEFIVDGHEFTAMLPEVYGGECEVYGPEDLGLSSLCCKGSIVDIVAEVLSQLDGAAAASVQMDVHHTPRLHFPATCLAVSSDDGLDMSDLEPSAAGCKSDIVERIQLEMLQLEAFDMECTIDANARDTAFVTLRVPIHGTLTRSTAEAWGLNRDLPLCFSFTIDKARYSRTDAQLDVKTWQEKDTSGY
eukprot:CAMPEP_0115321068 /NCGR_PEP_ID=MMETSP0270-20121206/80661_1 /TAXON_ID=71861 /ORGANISM="Scrippsiella trochoidea, Strain CCMP3099" /LENGTH=212 /DNA_ID=CAMNT_0002740921 /DNA_START=125 /DNA_END=761 /DNA_ORIENTATION=+